MKWMSSVGLERRRTLNKTMPGKGSRVNAGIQGEPDTKGGVFTCAVDPLVMPRDSSE